MTTLETIALANVIGMFQLFYRSNSKLGVMHYVKSTYDTCPLICAWKELGTCYDANSGRCIRNTRIYCKNTWEELLLKVYAKVPFQSALRINTGGDFPHHNGIVDRIPLMMLDSICHELKLKAFAYTHHELSSENIDTFHMLKSIRVRISCETNSRIEKAIDANLPVAIVSNETNRYSCNCKKKCVKCMRCYSSKKPVVLPPHGMGKKRMIEFLEREKPTLPIDLKPLSVLR